MINNNNNYNSSSNAYATSDNLAVTAPSQDSNELLEQAAALAAVADFDLDEVEAAANSEGIPGEPEVNGLEAAEAISAALDSLIAAAPDNEAGAILKAELKESFSLFADPEAAKNWLAGLSIPQSKLIKILEALKRLEEKIASGQPVNIMMEVYKLLYTIYGAINEVIGKDLLGKNEVGVRASNLQSALNALNDLVDQFPDMSPYEIFQAAFATNPPPEKFKDAKDTLSAILGDLAADDTSKALLAQITWDGSVDDRQRFVDFINAASKNLMLLAGQRGGKEYTLPMFSYEELATRGVAKVSITPIYSIDYTTEISGSEIIDEHAAQVYNEFEAFCINKNILKQQPPKSGKYYFDQATIDGLDATTRAAFDASLAKLCTADQGWASQHKISVSNQAEVDAAAKANADAQATWDAVKKKFKTKLANHTKTCGNISSEYGQLATETKANAEYTNSLQQGVGDLLKTAIEDIKRAVMR